MPKTVRRRRSSSSSKPVSREQISPSQERATEAPFDSQDESLADEKDRNGEAVDHLKTFASHGVEFFRKDGHEHKAQCPFCAAKSFSVNDVEGFFRCWDCGKKGNKYTFLQMYYDHCYEATNASHYKNLSKLRSLPPEAFSQAELAWDRSSKRWLIPVRNEKGSMVNIRHWNAERFVAFRDGKSKDKPWNMNTAGCKSHLYNLERADEKITTWIICEGEWDAIALEYLLTKAGVKDVCVVACPGANGFKEEWAHFFNNKIVYLLFDNDEAEEDKKDQIKGKEGQLRTASILRKETKARELHAIAWPESYPKGIDIRDYVGRSENLSKPKAAWSNLKKMVETLPLHNAKEEFNLVRTSFKEVVKDFKKDIFLSQELTDALAITFATVISNVILVDPYCPIWVFLTGASGSGKTLILQSVSGNEMVVCRDKLTANVLVSMYKTPDGSDASLLPQLIHKCFVLKDWTVVMRLPAGDQEIIHSIMRVAFDGRVDASSGIGINRSYPGDDCEWPTCHFSFISGVTDAIYLENRTDVGERTLKYRVLEGTESIWDILDAAANNTLEGKIPEDLLRASANAFLDHCINGRPHITPTMTDEMKDRLKGLGQIACICGTNVARKQGDVLMPPAPAVASRMVKMMIRLGQCLAYIFDKPTVDDEVYRILKRVGLSTCFGWGIKALMSINSLGEKGALREEIMSKASMKSSTTQRVLEDLLELESVVFEIDSKDEKGQPPKRWFLSETMKKYMKYAKLTHKDLVGMPTGMPRKRPGNPKKALNDSAFSSNGHSSSHVGVSGSRRRRSSHAPSHVEARKEDIKKGLETKKRVSKTSSSRSRSQVRRKVTRRKK